MRLPVPGPSDLLHAVRELAAAGAALGGAATGAIALVPRLEQALGRVEALLDRAEAAVGRIEQTAADADAAIASVGPLLSGVEGVLGRIDPVLVGAETAVGRVGGVIDGADRAIVRVDGVVDGAESAVGRVGGVIDEAAVAVTDATGVLRAAGGLVADASGLLGQAQAPLVELMPVLQRLADTLDPSEVDAAVLLIDRLPELLRAVDEDLLPLARQLTGVGPELHALLGLVEDLHDMVARLPGMGLVRRRKDPTG